MTDHEHRFQRLSDVAIFCECGEIRESPYRPEQTVIYPPVTVPYEPLPVTPWPWQPYQPWHPPFYYTTGGTTSDLGDYIVMSQTAVDSIARGWPA